MKKILFSFLLLTVAFLVVIPFISKGQNFAGDFSPLRLSGLNIIPKVSTWIIGSASTNAVFNDVTINGTCTNCGAGGGGGDGIWATSTNITYLASSTNLVGIGTTTPAVKLHTLSAGAEVERMECTVANVNCWKTWVTAGTIGGYIGLSDTGGLFPTGDNDTFTVRSTKSLRLQAGGSSDSKVIQIASTSGNTTIGTTTPYSSLLYVAGTTTIAGNLWFSDNTFIRNTAVRKIAQFEIEYPTSTAGFENHILLMPEATTTITKVKTLNKSVSSTVAFNLYVGTDYTIATGSLHRVFDALQTSNSTTTIQSLTPDGSSTIPVGSFLMFQSESASSTRLFVEVYGY